MYGYQTLRALVLGNALALGNTLASMLHIPQVVSVSTGRGKGRGGGKPRSHWYKRVVTSSTRVRDPSDPVQARLIAKAQAKRERRCRKLNTDTSYYSNPAHRFNERLNPFYINRSTTV